MMDDGATCVGAVVITEDDLRNQLLSIPVSASDGSATPGFTEGDEYKLRVWLAEQNKEFEIETEPISGPDRFTKHESVMLSLENSVFTKIGSLSENLTGEVECYPNPFKNELVIEIDLPCESEVEITVVNQMGQVVAFLTKGERLSSGIHRFFWHTQEEGEARIVPGLFYVLTQMDTVKKMNKVVLTK